MDSKSKSVSCENSELCSGSHDLNFLGNPIGNQSNCGPRNCLQLNSLQTQDSLSTVLKKSKPIHLNKASATKIVANHVKVASDKIQSKSSKDSGKKMDTCVPSQNLLNAPFAASPVPLSIYEQDRQNVYCGNSKVHYNLDVCSAITDESGGLDDHYEDSSLTNILTPELLSSMASSSSSSSAPAFTTTVPNLWSTKITGEEQSSHDGEQAPFIQFGDEADMLFSEFLNIDSNDSKFSIPDFDCMTSNPPSSCHTPVPSLESRSEFIEPTMVDRIGFMSRTKDRVPSSTSFLGDNIGQDFVQKKFTALKSNFPPRKSEPPVGIVAPVKFVDEKKRLFDHPVKVEVKDQTLCAVDAAEMSPQTVPSFSITNLSTGCSPVKMEPVSPEFTERRECLKRSLMNQDQWEDVNHPLSGDSFASTKSKRRRCDSGSSGITSEDGDCDDTDYGFQNDYDSDDDDLDADLAHMKPGSCESLIGGGKKQKQYFWQYNVQAKGPKGTRLKLAVGSPTDPHVLNGFEDPVFDECNTTVAGIRHGGKARKGDGNEVTPNPHKLFKIGHQLLRLSKKINACQLGSDVPAVQRNESRKEKNKLASRACRLKKKAQHEANKIKLSGLEMEHGQINNVLRLLWPELRERAKRLQNDHHVDDKPDQDSLFNKLNGYITSNLKNMVAGHTTDYVNDVIMTVEKGDLSGGLNLRPKKT